MLEIRSVTKKFSGGTIAVDRVSLKVGSGEFFSLLGPSGCGKTTLLRILAGLETPDSGEIWLDGARVDLLPPHRRPFNLVFQRYALFPHLSVWENIAFGLQAKKVAAPEIRARVEEALALVQMQGFEGRLPATLSGGQSQRIALARALVNRPRLLLLDEPLSALDLKLRQAMQVELRTIQKKLGHSFVFVTHDQQEALSLSDRVAVMNHGRVEQLGAPADIYERPGTEFVAQFIGSVNSARGVIEGIGESAGRVRIGDAVLEARNESALAPGARARLWIRPENLRLHSGAGPALAAVAQSALPVEVQQIIFQGPATQILVRLPTGETWAVLLASPEARGFEPGSRARLSFASQDAWLTSDSAAAPAPGDGA